MNLGFKNPFLYFVFKLNLCWSFYLGNIFNINEMERYSVNKQFCQPSDMLTCNCKRIFHSSHIVLGTKIRSITCKKMEHQFQEVKSLFFCFLNTKCLNSLLTIQRSCLFSSRPKMAHRTYWVFVVWERSCLRVTSLDVLLFAYLWMCMTWILIVWKSSLPKCHIQVGHNMTYSAVCFHLLLCN